MFGQLGVKAKRWLEIQDDVRFSYGMQSKLSKEITVKMGEVHPGFLKALELKQKVFFAEIRLEDIVRQVKNHSVTIDDLNKYPSVRRDLALVVQEKVSFKDIQKITNQVDKGLIKQINLFDVYRHDDHIGKDKKSYALSFVLEDKEKTLRDQEVDELLV